MNDTLNNGGTVIKMNKTEIALHMAEPSIRYRIVKITAPEAVKARLREFGIICGTEIIQTVRSRKGEIALYRVRGSRVALRRESAAYITVTKWE